MPLLLSQIAVLSERLQTAEHQNSEKDATLRIAQQHSQQQIGSLEGERDALNRRLRGLQKELEEMRSKVENASVVQQEVIAAAVAAKSAYIEELKATDMRIISEVRVVCLSRHPDLRHWNCR